MSHRDTPEYDQGYDDGFNWRRPLTDAEVYVEGYEAGEHLANTLKELGFTEVVTPGPDGPHRTFTLSN